VRSVVAESWLRSSAAGVDPDTHLAPVRLDGGDLADYRATHALSHVFPLLYDVLGRAAVDCDIVMAVGDAEGQLLWVCGPPGVLRRAETINFVEGSVWTEHDAGTNAPGMATAPRPARARPCRRALQPARPPLELCCGTDPRPDDEPGARCRRYHRRPRRRVAAESGDDPRRRPATTTSSAASGSAPVKGAVLREHLAGDRQAVLRGRRGTAEDIELALDAAHGAKRPPGARPRPAERSNILLKIADRMEENLELLAVAETWDNGKPVRETLAADIPLAIDHFRYFAGCIRAQEGSMAEIDDDTVAYHFHEPLGVVGQIIPWNFPILMAVWKLAPALAAGNCVVLKPAEQTPVDPVLLPSSSATCCRPACSTSSTASASRPASRWPPARASPRSPSPARPRPAG
jgi:hypothetical protein